MRLTAAITRDGSWWVARCLEVEVTSQGESFDGARANLAEALELYFEDEPHLGGLEPPIIAPVDIRIAGVSPRLPRVSGDEVGGVLQRAGFEAVSQRGSHRKLRHADGRIVIVPLHRELATGTFASILRQAGLSAVEFEALR